MDTDMHKLLRYVLNTRYELRCLGEYEKADRILGQLLEKYKILDLPADKLRNDKVSYILRSDHTVVKNYEFVWDQDCGTKAVERHDRV